jgi:hypothetical protein
LTGSGLHGSDPQNARSGHSPADDQPDGMAHATILEAPESVGYPKLAPAVVKQ